MLIDSYVSKYIYSIIQLKLITNQIFNFLWILLVDYTYK